jgi:hypothetical protein
MFISPCFLELLEQTFNKLISHCEQIIMLVAQLSANYIVNVSIRVYDISDADIGFGIRTNCLASVLKYKSLIWNRTIGHRLKASWLHILLGI